MPLKAILFLPTSFVLKLNGYNIVIISWWSETKSILDLKEERIFRASIHSDGITIKLVKMGYIIKFLDSDGPGKLLNFSIADSPGAMLATLSAKTKQARIMKGKTILVRDFNLKGAKCSTSHTRQQ